MKTKLPLVMLAATSQSLVPPAPQRHGSKAHGLGVSPLHAGKSDSPGESKSDLLGSIWKDAGATQRKAMEGTNTVDIVGAKNTTGVGLDGALSDLMERVEATGWDSRLVVVPKMGGSDQVGLGPLAKAFVMEMYEQKYDITIGSVVFDRPSFEVVGEAEGTISDASLKKVVDVLEKGEQAGVIVVDGKHGHSAAIILQNDPDTNRLQAVSLDSMPNTNSEYDYEMALAPISDALGKEIDIKSGSNEIAQRDSSSCNTLSCVLARDVLRKKDSNFALEPRTDKGGPVETMKTAQWEGYLKKTKLDRNTVLNPETQRTYGDHRDDHTTKEDGKPRNHYLRAKTMNYAERTLDWIESMSGDKTKTDAARKLLEQAYPGNDAVKLLDGERKDVGQSYD